MRSTRLAILSILALSLSATVTAAGQEKVLYSFNDNGVDGYSSESGLIFDSSGNLYGTTIFGGTYGYGTVFELTPKAGGTWTEKVLHSFDNSSADGGYPGAGVIFDSSGNLYGTAEVGGNYDDGTVFELTPQADGSWTEKVLHSFNSKSKDGVAPSSVLTFDASGNLYGTTSSGGAAACSYNVYGCGTVFELTPKAGGTWGEKVLHSFSDAATDGFSPLYEGVIFDALGNLYGTTRFGGTGDCGGGGLLLHCGIVFELTPKASGGWSEKALYRFRDNGADGIFPSGNLIFDAAGDLYGTTLDGGAYTTGGTVFELMPKASGSWSEKVLHSFKSSSSTDGSEPYAGLIFDSMGNTGRRCSAVPTVTGPCSSSRLNRARRGCYITSAMALTDQNPSPA
jgi:uncharacterized repeat protein (TIGR03803 family)